MDIKSVALRGIKTFRGMDGHGLNATLVVNDKAVAFILDEGCGGETMMQPVAGGPTRRDLQEIEVALTAYARTRIPDEKLDWDCPRCSGAADCKDCDGTGKFMSRTDWRTLVNEMVDAQENERRLRRLCKTKTLFILPTAKRGEFWTLNKPYSPDTRAYLLNKYGPETEIVNERF